MCGRTPDSQIVCKAATSTTSSTVRRNRVGDMRSRSGRTAHMPAIAGRLAAAEIARSAARARAAPLIVAIGVTSAARHGRKERDLAVVADDEVARHHLEIHGGPHGPVHPQCVGAARIARGERAAQRVDREFACIDVDGFLVDLQLFANAREVLDRQFHVVQPQRRIA
ncbi:hypothetical protein BURMUCGD2_6154 [Burkholderia multivorans CGD2]|uniref:Uncharacterized protein n=1 Tax=Burkholderia multivorans CGD2 TaxID=513052 RepID=B9BWR6_9BURK|nr:hypothetical protein BURMUCGD2_6154 [Burkholderia multivorans CGD2]